MINNSLYQTKINNLTGLSMDMMAERLRHLLNVIDFSSINTIFDIGAAHGYESYNLARVFEHSMIYGFEPTPEHYEYCLKHYASIDESIKARIYIENIALNDTDGRIKFYPLDDNAQSNNTGMASKFKLIDPHVFPHEHNLQKEIEVDSRSLNSWCTEHKIYPDLIWMDAQGAELDILKGGNKILETTKVVMTEAALKPYYHGHTMKYDIDQYLTEYGFKELTSACKLMHEYEVDTIYINQKYVIQE